MGPACQRRDARERAEAGRGVGRAGEVGAGAGLGAWARCACSDVDSGLVWGSCVATVWGPRERCQAGCVDAEEALTLLADKRGQGGR